MNINESDVADLLAVDDDEYLSIVADSFDHTLDWKTLLEPALVDRTLFALESLKILMQKEENGLHERIHSFDGRSAGRERTEIRRSLAKVKARRAELGLRMQQVQRSRGLASRQRVANEEILRQKAHSHTMERNAAATRDTARRLTLAIQRHRLAVLAGEFAPEPADRALWAMLDEIKVSLGQGTVTLTEMLSLDVWHED